MGFFERQMIEWKNWKKWRPMGKEESRPSPARERMKSLFEKEKISYRMIPHPTTFTAPELAAAIHVPGREVAKVVVVRANGQFMMAVLPANLQLDLVRFSQLAGTRRVSLATEREMKALFPDCEIGAEPPFGNFYGLPVYVDASLAAQEEIFFQAGTHDEVIEMRYADFDRLVRPDVDRIALAPLKSASGW